jgi:hypothetical protein
MLRNMSLLAATWTGVGATVGLFLGAIVTARYAIKAFRKQSEEVQLLQQQAERDIEQRRRAQPTQVFAWVESRPFQGNPEDMRAAACLRNKSAQPVYNILLGWGDSGQQRQRVLLPGEEHIMPGVGSTVADGKLPVWAEFRDAAGVRWRTTSEGELAELP